jgi:hypothetical protein
MTVEVMPKGADFFISPALLGFPCVSLRPNGVQLAARGAHVVCAPEQLILHVPPIAPRVALVTKWRARQIEKEGSMLK